ncbi:VOC family protein [Saccharospirillum salsuginis]|nr:VOC family protein [Saccharospirillum salsuginis]
MELDHLFIAVPGPEVGHVFKELGFTEGTPNRHPGQGTANRRFFFANAFIELLYLVDREEALRPVTAPTRLYERLTATPNSVSPFGVCFRASEPDETPGFSYWDYCPNYLPPGLSIPVAEAPLEEPMWFFLPFGQRPDQMPPERAQPLVHSCGVRALTHTHLTLPVAESEAARMADSLHDVSVDVGDSPLLELEFDHHRQGKVLDLRPELPMLLRL